MTTGQQRSRFSFDPVDLFPRLMAFLARDDVPPNERLATALRVFEPLAVEFPRGRMTGLYGDTLRRYLDVDLDPGEEHVAVLVFALRKALQQGGQGHAGRPLSDRGRSAESSLPAE